MSMFTRPSSGYLSNTLGMNTPEQGAYVGTVVKVNGADEDGTGFSENITYDVAYESMNGASYDVGIIPSHRRPITAPGLVVAARVNDKCIVCVSVDRRSYIIFEGLPPTTCDPQP